MSCKLNVNTSNIAICLNNFSICGSGPCSSIIPLLGITNSIRKNAVGTAVEIRSCSDQCINLATSHDELIVTAKGKTRFKIFQTSRYEQSHSTYVANVLFLDEGLKCIDYSKLSRQNLYGLPFPNWVYASNSPKMLARKAYSLYSSMLFKPVPIVDIFLVEMAM